MLIAHAGTAHIFDRGKVAADDLHLGSVAAGIVIGDGKADHIDAHVRRALVGALAQDLLHQGTDYREGLDVTVIVDRGFVVGLKMEGVDDVGVVEVGRGGLIGNVDRMREGQIPDRESLELGVAGGRAVLVLVIELRQAGGELARAGAGSGDYDERSGGLDKLVLAVAIVGHDQVDIVRIPLDGIVQLGGNTERVQAVAEHIGSRLAGVLGDDHSRDGKAVAAEQVNQAQHILVIGNAKVTTSLVFLDVVRVDRDDNLDIVGDALEHAELAVRFKTRQHAARMIVIEQLTAKLQIELATKLRDALLNVSSLQLDILRIVETLAHVWLPSRFQLMF